MKLAILCTDPTHPVMPSLRRWRSEMEACGHAVSMHSDKSTLTHGDLLFLVSCSQVVRATDRARFRTVLVLHASDLPKGRGMSPHVWAVLAGASEITVTAFEACDPVDSGDIWFKTVFSLEGHELLPEINEKLFEAELNLMTRAVDEALSVRPNPQVGEPDSLLRGRTPMDSRLDPDKTLAEQFELLRVVDNSRYPAFMDYRGHRYIIKIDKG
ncbi:MAG: formyltransferase family protein [Vicinamibacterales bacterium]